MPEFVKKIRITGYDNDMNMQFDRLVAMDTELKSGPKEPHSGPIKLEILLSSEEELDLFLNSYLPKLSGRLPIVSKVKPPKAGDNLDDDPDSRSKIVDHISSEEIGNQTEAVSYLRSLGFVFVTEDYMKDLGILTDVQMGIFLKLSNNGYTFMVLRVKRSKTDPMLDKYDPKILFGFNLNEVLPIKCIFFDELFSLDKSVSEKKIKAKTEFAKFPPYMVEEERFKFSKELRLLRDNDEKQPSKFFLRWYNDVSFQGKDTFLEDRGKEVKTAKVVKKVKKPLHKG